MLEHHLTGGLGLRAFDALVAALCFLGRISLRLQALDDRERRRAEAPTATNPTSMVATVPGSGTAAIWLPTPGVMANAAEGFNVNQAASISNRGSM